MLDWCPILTPVNQSDQPGDWFLCLHLQQCLVHSVGCSDVLEDYRPQEVENLMEELGVDGSHGPTTTIGGKYEH